jgi:hypothetical protein
MERQLLKKSKEVFRVRYPSMWTENANAFLLETQNRAADAVGLLKVRHRPFRTTVADGRASIPS